MIMEAQHTIEWYRKRLGKFTGSQVECLIKSPRSNTQRFTDTAKSYIYQIAAERTMNPAIVDDDELLGEYVRITNAQTKAMRWGDEQEEAARYLYASTTDSIIAEVGLMIHPEYDFFGSSPDGVVVNRDGELIGCIEVKCPTQAVYMRYADLIRDGTSLREVKAEYYYQCQSHMLVTGTLWCDFVIYCPWQSKPIHIARIIRSEEACKFMLSRVIEANEFAGVILN